ncbi:MAG: RNA polymerase sigma factor [Microbacteriaceae bacterium]
MMGASSQKPTRAASEQFEHAIKPLMRPLLSYFERRVIPREEAADCLSETLLVLWRTVDRLPLGEEDLRAFSYGVARNVLANHRRGAVRKIALANRLRQLLEPEAPDQRSILEATELLAGLKNRDRELVILVVLDGFSLNAAAAHLRIKPATARARYARARAALRTAWVFDQQADRAVSAIAE